MTGDEIIKILEENTAEHLAVYMNCHTPNGIVLVSPTEILDLINHKNAEIKMLKKLLGEEEKKNQIFAKRFFKEGAKDFVERLKKKVQKPEFPWEDFFICESDIDEVLKEMEGENKW